ncbi:hypothetical protein [Cryobacterium sp. BB307]|nr:hypothetical protein [Cryobacterium sp. BB307]
MSSKPQPRRRWQMNHDDLFYGTVTITGLLAYIGYGLLFAWAIGRR